MASISRPVLLWARRARRALALSASAFVLVAPVPVAGSSYPHPFCRASDLSSVRVSGQAEGPPQLWRGPASMNTTTSLEPLSRTAWTVALPAQTRWRISIHGDGPGDIDVQILSASGAVACRDFSYGPQAACEIETGAGGAFQIEVFNWASGTSVVAITSGS